VRSGRFLHQGQAQQPPAAAGDGVTPAFFIVVPVLREAAVLRQTIGQFQTIACGHAAIVVVVTTARHPSLAQPVS
jgi:hypothetical protein